MRCFVQNRAVRLHAEELAEVLAFDPNAEGTPQLDGDWALGKPTKKIAMVSACSSSATVVKIGHSRVVQFSHFSVGEVFDVRPPCGGKRRCLARYHLLLLQPTHTTLAQACFSRSPGVKRAQFEFSVVTDRGRHGSSILMRTTRTLPLYCGMYDLQMIGLGAD
jgi:hypothetical protein